jgi:CHASE2 domain
VLAKKIQWVDQTRQDSYKTESNVYDGFPFGSRSQQDSPNVTKGYLSLADADVRYIPPILKLDNGQELKSFSLAIVAARSQKAMKRRNWSDLMFASFLQMNEIETVSAAHVCCANPDRDVIGPALEHQIVIIGGIWHKDGPGIGERVDLWETPRGLMPGVYLHANYVEAILDQRVYPLLQPDWRIEAFVGLLFASMLALRLNRIKKAAMIVVGIAGTVAASYILLQNVGVYCDVVILDILLIGHIVVEGFLKSWLAPV